MESDREAAIRQLALLAGCVGAGITLAAGVLTGHSLRGIWVGPIIGAAIWITFRYMPRFLSK
jgi:hypothetical protein